MKGNQLLAVVSAAQLGAGLGGLVLAIRRRHAFDIPFWHGQESAVTRDALLMGTALSAPAAMLVTQAGATAAVLRRPDAIVPPRVLGGLGAAMVAGYLMERLVRRRLHPSGWDAAESPMVIAGLSLAVAMARLGLPRPVDEAIGGEGRSGSRRG
jgi:hypothetical protein